MNPYRPHRLMAVPPTPHARVQITKAIWTLAAQGAEERARQRSEIGALRHDLETISELLRKRSTNVTAGRRPNLARIR